MMGRVILRFDPTGAVPTVSSDTVTISTEKDRQR